MQPLYRSHNFPACYKPITNNQIMKGIRDAPASTMNRMKTVAILNCTILKTAMVVVCTVELYSYIRNFV
jgi:hypothetical protein